MYPLLDESLCVGCNLCHKVCPYENMPERHGSDKYAFGGYIKVNKLNLKAQVAVRFQLSLILFATKIM